jgi:hypothetical protein
VLLNPTTTHRLAPFFLSLKIADNMASDDKPSPGSDVEKNISPTKGHVDTASSIGAEDAFEGYVIDKAMEKRMLRKFDLIILPTVALMYLFKCV